MGSSTTNELEKVLKTIDRTSRLREFIETEDRIKEELSFSEYFASLSTVAEMEKAELIRRSGLERTYAYQILNGTRKPGRNKVIALSLAAGLKEAEIQKALKAAGYTPLYVRSRRDAILLYAVGQKLTVEETEELLEQMGEASLEE